MRLALAVFFALTAAPALAQNVACAPRDLVVQRLLERYGETLQNIGLHQDRNLVEVYASPASGSWTILKVTPEGVACMIAAGEMWQAAWPAPVGEPL